MAVWSEPLSVLSRRLLWHKLCLGILVVVFITIAIFSLSSHFAAAAPKVMNFSAKLKNASGALVADGFYNVQFKLYSQSAGGAPIWTETYYDTNGLSTGGDNRLKVVNGYLSVKLGSIQAFSDINWNDDLWLTMNIGGTEQNSSIGSITWDGEMSPRIQLTATAYSMNSEAVGGKKADQLVQIGQGKQTDSSNNSSIYLNKTGTGNLIQLQSNGKDSFILSQDGSVTLGAVSDQSIKVGQAATGGGRNLTVSAGSGAANENGGKLVLTGGDGELGGGGVEIDSGSGSSGSITLGSVNASNISIGNTNSTTTVGGTLQTNNLDTENETALKLGENNATEIQLGQDTVIDEGKTLTVQGDTLVKSTTDSETALQVQNSAGEKQLTVDTENSQVKIGSNNSSGTLLVLDNKSSSSDPEGTSGAMYYSSTAGKFRCFEGGEWVDCITPLPVSKVIKTEVSNDTDQAVDASGLTFDLKANTKYYYKFVIMHEADDEMTGVGFGIKAPENLEMSNWCVNTIGNLGSTNGHWGSYCGVGDANATTTGEEGVGTKFTSTMEGYIETRGTPGDLNLRFKSQTSTKTTIKPGSFGILQIVQ